MPQDLKLQSVKKFLQRWIITTLAVLVAAHIVAGIHYDTRTGLIVATLVLGILNAVVRPIMVLFSLPLLIFTLGLFWFVINALLLYWVGQHIKDFHVDDFWAAFWGALIISLVSLLLNILTGTGNARIQFQRGNKPPPPPKDDGKGPVIDV